MCIRRTLADGWRHGIASGLGAATADAFYGAIAAFGLHSISNLLIRQTDILSLLGGLFLAYLGYKTLRARPAPLSSSAHAPSSRVGVWSAYASVFFLTLTNPMTILSFLGIFAGLGFADVAGEIGAGLVVVAGVFVGSALWWLLLSGGVGIVRARFDGRWMLWVNRLSGSIILLFALRILLDVL